MLRRPAAVLVLSCLPLLLAQCEIASMQSPASQDAALLGATKEAPFVNSLGMKFVPVPRTKILMCITETTLTQYHMAEGVQYWTPDYPHDGNHPACMGINDAKAWCRWLSQKEGRRYRLPKDAEWSAAVGAASYPWGAAWPPPANCGNYMGQETKTAEMQRYLQGAQWFKYHGFSSISVIGGFSDGHLHSAPVGSYPANSLGIHDLGGNVWEWMGDGYVMRGGSWLDTERGKLTSSNRFDYYVAVYNDVPSSSYVTAAFRGFRCVVEF